MLCTSRYGTGKAPVKIKKLVALGFALPVDSTCIPFLLAEVLQLAGWLAARRRRRWLSLTNNTNILLMGLCLKPRSPLGSSWTPLGSASQPFALRVSKRTEQ